MSVQTAKQMNNYRTKVLYLWLLSIRNKIVKNNTRHGQIVKYDKSPYQRRTQKI